MKKTYRIGVDLGGTNIATGLVDENNKVVDKISCKTGLPRPAHDLEQAIAQQCRSLAQKNNLSLEQMAQYKKYWFSQFFLCYHYSIAILGQPASFQRHKQCI